ncbi:MAG: hypothetical protein AAF802_04770 [Planctomycetota bacterium]
MAKVMKAKLIQDALEANESVTVLAVPDKTLADVSAKFGERVLFAFEHLIVPGRFNTDSISKNSGKWLLPMGSRSPTSGWRLKPHPNKVDFELFPLGPEGLPAEKIECIEKNIECTGGVIHLLGSFPKSLSMTRGGLLEQDICRKILQSAMERCEIRESRGELEAAIEILAAALDSHSAATYDTAAIYKSYLQSNVDESKLPKFVPARTFVILNAGFTAGLSLDEKERGKKLRIYRSAIELATTTLDPEALIETRRNTALATARERFDSYREALDLARYGLRLRGLTDKGWLGEQALFAR